MQKNLEGHELYGNEINSHFLLKVLDELQVLCYIVTLDLYVQIRKTFETCLWRDGSISDYAKY